MDDRGGHALHALTVTATDDGVTGVQHPDATAHGQPALAGCLRAARLADHLAVDLQHGVAAHHDQRRVAGQVLRAERGGDCVSLGPCQGLDLLGRTRCRSPAPGGSGSELGEHRRLINLGDLDPWGDPSGTQGSEATG